MSALLPLHPGAKPCVRCGFCCKVCSCGYGEWDEKKHRCKELVDNGDGTYDCGKYEEIIGSSNEEWHLAPAFGAGCCSSFNTDREAVLRARRDAGDGGRSGVDAGGDASEPAEF